MKIAEGEIPNNDAPRTELDNRGTWSDEDIEHCLMLKEAGYKGREIAIALNRSAWAVSARLKRLRASRAT